MSAVSKKLFIRLAQEFKGGKPNGHSPDYYQWILMCLQTSRVFAEFNPTFDRRRFLASCGLSDQALAEYYDNQAPMDPRGVLDA